MSFGPLIVVSGPSGSGKSTLIRRLLAESELPLRLSVSATTRRPRPGERDGVDYHFWDRDRFAREIDRNAFLEWAEVFGNYYGTLCSEVEPPRAEGSGVLLDIDVQGWQKVRSRCPQLAAIFVRTSSLAVLEERLRQRRTEDEPALQRRLRGAERELLLADQYDYQVINDDLECAVTSLKGIVEDLFKDHRWGPCN